MLLFDHIYQTLSTVQSFSLTMALYPEVQRKAYQQIEKVVGNDRLPDFEDRPNLPYVEAIVKEAFRWQPVLPFGECECDESDQGQCYQSCFRGCAQSDDR